MMEQHSEPTYTQVHAVFQEIDDKFDTVIKMLKTYGNTITTEKQLDKWATIYQNVLSNAGYTESKEECIERLRGLISKLAGFHVHFRKSEYKHLPNKHGWKMHNYNNDIILERKA